MFIPAATTSMTRIGGCWNTLTTFVQNVGTLAQLIFGAVVPATSNMAITLPTFRVSGSASSTLHIVAIAAFTVSTMTVSAAVQLRRVG